MFNGVQNLFFQESRTEFMPYKAMYALAKYIENNSKKSYNESGDKFGNKIQRK